MKMRDNPFKKKKQFYQLIPFYGKNLNPPFFFFIYIVADVYKEWLGTLCFYNFVDIFNKHPINRPAGITREHTTPMAILIEL